MTFVIRFIALVRWLLSLTALPREGCDISAKVVEMSGLEPPTPTLSGWCSNLLSYIPLCLIKLL